MDSGFSKEVARLSAGGNPLDSILGALAWNCLQKMTREDTALERGESLQKSYEFMLGYLANLGDSNCAVELEALDDANLLMYAQAVDPEAAEVARNAIDEAFSRADFRY